jgi:hypothetical protein
MFQLEYSSLLLNSMIYFFIIQTDHDKFHLKKVQELNVDEILKEGIFEYRGLQNVEVDVLFRGLRH